MTDADFKMTDLVKEASEAVEAESSTEDTADAQSESTPETQEVVEEKKEEHDFDNDEEFKKEVPEEYHKNKRWQGIYTDRKQYRAEAETLKERISELESKTLEDDELVDELNKRGLLENLSPEQTQQQPELTYDLENLSPEQRQYVKFNEWLIDRKMGEIRQEVTGLKQESVQSRQANLQKSFADDEAKMVEYCTKDLKIDFEKEIKPHALKLIEERSKENPAFAKAVRPSDVIRLVLSEKGIDIGKRLGQEELRKLNEKKKNSQMETGDMLSDGKVDYGNMSYKDLIRTAQQKFPE